MSGDLWTAWKSKTPESNKSVLANTAASPVAVRGYCQVLAGATPYGDAVYTDFDVPLGAGEQAACIEEIEALCD
jgi:hypothetical protein